MIDLDRNRSIPHLNPDIQSYLHGVHSLLEGDSSFFGFKDSKTSPAYLNIEESIYTSSEL